MFVVKTRLAKSEGSEARIIRGREKDAVGELLSERDRDPCSVQTCRQPGTEDRAERIEQTWSSGHG